MSMFGVSFLTPILSGVITDRLSWRWTFGLVSIFAGLLVPFILLFVPEHAFNRDVALARDEKSRPTQSPDSAESVSTPPRQSVQMERDEWIATRQVRGWGPFWPSLALFTGRKSAESLWRILLRPFPLMLHPAVLWGSLTQGTLIVFLVAISTVIAEIFGGPPNFFSNTKVGYFYVGPFVGGIIGFIAGISSYPSQLYIRC